MQIAAGGTEHLEKQAAALLLRAISLDPELAASYDNLMLVADLLRAGHSALDARNHYARAAVIYPLRYVGSDLLRVLMVTNSWCGTRQVFPFHLWGANL